jgi:hypothetical protein
MYTVKVKCNGVNHTWTQTEHFDNEPTNADIKGVVAKAKKDFYEALRQSARKIDVSVTPGKPSKDDDDELVAA